MDATPPGAAGTASRPSRSTPSGMPLLLRRLAVGLAGLALAVLAGAACALSFDDLRALAIVGRAQPRLAYLYPTAFDALLVVSLTSVPLLRGGRLLVRLQAGFVLLLLLASAAAATVATATATTFDPRQSAIVVALLPWVMLTLGLWLLLILLKHARVSRADLDDVDGLADAEDLVPFDGEREPRRSGTAQGPTAPYAVVPDAAAPPDYATPLPMNPVPEAVAPRDYVAPLPVSPVAETVAPPEYAPPLPATPAKHTAVPASHRSGTASGTDFGTDFGTDPDTASGTDSGTASASETPSAESASGSLTPSDNVPSVAGGRDAEEVRTSPEVAAQPGVMPLVPPTAAPQTPPVTELPPVPEPAPPTAPKRNRPIRWGDLVRPHSGDVLVHPMPQPARDLLPTEEPPSGTAERTSPDAPDAPLGAEHAAEADAASEPPVEATEPAVDAAAVDEAGIDAAGIDAAAADAAAVDEAGIDTQPLRQIRDVPATVPDPAHATDQVPDPAHATDHVADPAHATEAAELEEQSTTRRKPYSEETGGQTGTEAGEGSVPLAPPSGRMRSTPRPPT